MKDMVLRMNNVSCKIHCGKGAFEKYAPEHKGEQLFLVSDDNVFTLYEKLIKDTFGDIPKVILSAGESAKSATNLLKILREMLNAGMRRNCRVIAFGGGVIGDIAGLAAALYMRGVKLTQIPTTLLAQVDSSVGGKTAIDFEGVKNAVGTFYNADEVIADPLFLKTLKQREIKCGLGEVIKYAALSEKIFTRIRDAEGGIFSEKLLEKIVPDCIAYKRDVVTEDENDTLGIREALNLGHTTAHAFELYYGGKSHGEWVLIGMYYELSIAEKEGVCDGEHAEALRGFIESVIKVPALDDIDESSLGALRDKKNTSELIKLVVPVDIGKFTTISLSYDRYLKYLKESSINEIP